MIEIKIEDFHVPSLNQALSTWKHISKWKKIKEDFGWLVLSEIHRIRIEVRQLQPPLILEIEVSFKGNKYDVDNTIMYSKLFLDTFKKYIGIDDSYKLIQEVRLKINPEVKKDIVIYTLCPKKVG